MDGAKKRRARNQGAKKLKGESRLRIEENHWRVVYFGPGPVEGVLGGFGGPAISLDIGRLSLASHLRLPILCHIVASSSPQFLQKPV